MMKALFLMLFALASLPVFAGRYDLEIQRAERSCGLQQRSLLRDREGTPACDNLRQLRRAKRQHEDDRTINRAIDSMNRPIVIEHHHQYPPSGYGENGGGYYFNNAIGQYCHHGANGRVLSCD